MARDRRPRRRRGVLRHYDRPLWRDRMFWVVAVPSVLITGALVGLLLVVGGVPDGPAGWLRPVLVGLIVLLLAFRLLGAGITTTRHFQRGLGEGTTRRDSAMEARGRVAGRMVGTALRSARTPRSGSPTPAPAATPDRRTDPPPGAEPAPGAAPAPTPASPEPEATPATSGPATPPAPAAPTGSAPDPPAPKVTADAAARVAGAMVGRRLAERRRRRDQPPT